MSRTVHSPYELLSSQMASETLQSIMDLNDPVMFYTRMTQLIQGAIFEGIQIGLSVADAQDAPGPAELLTAYSAGVTDATKRGGGEA